MLQIRQATRSALAVCALALATLGLARPAVAKSACIVEPFRTVLEKGSSRTLAVTVPIKSKDDAVSVEVGNLPRGVSSGFPRSQEIKTVGMAKRMDLFVSAGDSPQIGSFMIPLLYRAGDSGESICQFNLVVRGSDESQAKAYARSDTETTRSITDRSFFVRLWIALMGLFQRQAKR